MARTYHIDCTTTDAYADSLEARYLGDRHADLVIGHEDADVLRVDGTRLAMLRRGVLSADVCRDALPALRQAAKPSLNRGAAAGGRDRAVKRDGTVSNTHASKPVLSGVAGYLDRTPRFPFCRTTAYTREDVEGWAAILSYIRAVDAVFRDACPDRYAAQMAAVRATPPEWVIPGTAFTTVTVNRNWQTAVHKDEGDLAEGFGVMSVVEGGPYAGGRLVFPKYRVAVDVRHGDVLLADVHEWHGNTPIVATADRSERISTVMYYRSGMRYCLPPADELRHAKRRQPGDPLY